MAEQTIESRGGATGWEYGREYALRYLEEISELMASCIKSGQASVEIPDKLLDKAVMAYEFLMSMQGDASSIERTTADRFMTQLCRRSGLHRAAMSVVAGTLATGFAIGMAPLANAEPIRDTTVTTSEDGSLTVEQRATIERMRAQMSDKDNDPRNAILYAAIQSIEQSARESNANKPSPESTEPPRIIGSGLSDQDNQPSTKAKTDQAQPTATPIDGSPNITSMPSTNQNPSSVADLLGIVDDTGTNSTTSSTPEPKKANQPIVNPFATLGQVDPTQKTVSPNDDLSQSNKTLAQPSSDEAIIFDPEIDSAPVPSADPTASVDTSALVGVDKVTDAISRTAKAMTEAIKGGDQAKIAQLATDSREELGDVGSLIAMAEGWGDIEQVVEEQPTTPGGVTPSHRITKKALEQVRKYGGSKANQDARILILNTAIKYADMHDSPAARYKPVDADPDYKAALKARGIDPAQKGFGSWVNDCMVFVKTVMQDSGVDKRFATSKSGGHMNTVAVYDALVKTGKAGVGSDVKYDLFKLSELDTSQLIPGDIVIRKGHVSIWMGGVEGEDGTSYDIAESARKSARVPSFVTVAYLDYMHASDMTLVVRVNLSDNSKIDYSKAPKNEKVKKGTTRPLLDLIAKGESGGNYNAYFGNAKNKAVKLTEMTIDEVLKWQDEYVADGSPSSAAGKYQFIRGTLRGLAKTLGMNKFEVKFSPETQDKMAIKLLEQRGLNDYISGKISAKQFAANIAKEWAALPKTIGKNPNASYYAGDGLNAGHIKVEAVLKAIEAILAR